MDFDVAALYAMLRWLGRTPESFVPGHKAGAAIGCTKTTKYTQPNGKPSRKPRKRISFVRFVVIVAFQTSPSP